MPLYEYRCSKCGAQFEKIRKFSDPPLTKCEECGGRLERLLSPPAVHFKGTGWYVTDYARKGAASEGKGSDGDSSSKSESSTSEKAKKTSEPVKAAGPNTPSKK